MGIKLFRLRNKLTQARFAEQMDVDVRTVQRWDNGDQYPSRKHRIKFKDLNQKADTPVPRLEYMGVAKRARDYRTILIIVAIAVILFIVLKLFIL